MGTSLGGRSGHTPPLALVKALWKEEDECTLGDVLSVYCRVYRFRDNRDEWCGTCRPAFAELGPRIPSAPWAALMLAQYDMNTKGSTLFFY